MLYIIATPIGNLEDITFRSIRILKEVDLILTEDTRRSGILLHHYEIKNKLSSYHEFTSEKKENEIIDKLLKGQKIALISDAGTPLISDPGFTLIKKARENNIEVTSLPGPSASITALAASGFTTDAFSFYGFFPKKKSDRNKIIRKIKENNITSILYESPHRINKSLKILQEHFPGRKICIARELTKKFEEFIIGTTEYVLEVANSREIKGEITLIIQKETDKNKIKKIKRDNKEKIKKEKYEKNRK